jgi:hypothetical protein
MRTLLQHGMRLHAIGECAKRLLAHSPTALSELKPCISQEIIIQNEKKLDSFYLDYMGWIKTKKPSHATVPLRGAGSCTHEEQLECFARNSSIVNS